MPAELFRSELRATPIRRRASLLPLSITAHVVAIAAVVIAPIFATAELPDPPRQLLYETVDVILPPPPPVNPAPPGPAPTSDPRKAPTDAPPHLLPEPDVVTPGRDTGTVVVGGFEPGMAGIDGSLTTRVVEPLPPPPAVPTGPVKVGGQIKPPRRLVNVAPVYPPIAQQARVEGEVEIEAVIGEDGRVREARVTRGKPLLNDAALAAVRQWTFTPTTLNGEPVAVVMTVTVVFTLR